MNVDVRFNGNLGLMTFKSYVSYVYIYYVTNV